MTEAEARERRQQRDQAIVAWFETACAEEDGKHDQAFTSLRDLAAKLREEAAAAHSRASQAQARADAMRRAPRPTHDDLRAEKDKRLKESAGMYDDEMRVVLGSRGFADLSHWTH